MTVDDRVTVGKKRGGGGGGAHTRKACFVKSIEMVKRYLVEQVSVSASYRG